MRTELWPSLSHRWLCMLPRCEFGSILAQCRTIAKLGIGDLHPSFRRICWRALSVALPVPGRRGRSLSRRADQSVAVLLLKERVVTPWMAGGTGPFGASKILLGQLCINLLRVRTERALGRRKRKTIGESTKNVLALFRKTNSASRVLMSPSNECVGLCSFLVGFAKARPGCQNLRGSAQVFAHFDMLHRNPLIGGSDRNMPCRGFPNR